MAVSNVSKTPIGGGQYETYGVFAHTAGDAEETVKVEGKVYSVSVQHDSTSERASVPEFSTSVSGQLTTVTFRYTPGVSAGTFTIRHGFRP